MFTLLQRKIFITLFVLLSLGGVLGGFVFVGLWQKDLVAIEITRSSAMLRSTIALGPATPEGMAKRMHTLCTGLSEQCLGYAVYMQGKQVVSSGGALAARMTRFAERNTWNQSGSYQVETSMLRMLWNQKALFFIAEPFTAMATGPKDSLVVFVGNLDTVQRMMSRGQKILLAYLLVNALFLTVIGFFRFSDLIVKPVKEMIRVSESFGESRTAMFVAEEGHSEFSQLSIALNTMLRRIEADRSQLEKAVHSLECANAELKKTQKEMIRAEKMASVGRLTAGLAHEIGNPMGIVQGYVELLGDHEIAREERGEFAARALKELARVDGLIANLLGFTRQEGTTQKQFDIATTIEDVLEILTVQAKKESLLLEKELEQELIIQGDEEGIRQVLLNCLLNAMDAVQESRRPGKVVVVARKELLAKEASQIIIKITDNGCGIAPDDVENIFDPFYTTKQPGKGTGLGLFVSHSIVEAHGGEIWIEATSDHGTTLCLRFFNNYKEGGLLGRAAGTRQFSVF